MQTLQREWTRPANEHLEVRRTHYVRRCGFVLFVHRDVVVHLVEIRMKQFGIGNVIKSPDGGMWIVTKCDERIVQAVSFDTENCSAVQQLDDHTRNETCHDCMEECGYAEENDEDYTNPDCETCHGTFRYERKIKGWKHSKVLATTVRNFILSGVKKTWGI